MHDYSLEHLSDEAVTQELAAATSADRRALAAHLARIAEFDRRALFLERGCSSMYRYCVDRLKLSEDAAVQRIRAARTARSFPGVFAAIADGRLNLTTVVLASTRLTAANATELLAEVEHRTSKQVRRLLADRFGAPRWVVRFVPTSSALEPVRSDAAPPAAPAGLPVLKRVLAPSSCAELAGDPVPVVAPKSEEPVSTPPARQARLTPIGPGLTELVAVLGEEACAQLEASRDLLGHAVPSGNLAEVLERAIALQYATLRKRRCADADRPRVRSGENADEHDAADPRRIPAAVRRAVWRRDGGRCAFVGAGGHRCEERSRLELDHVVPVAGGGEATAANLRLLCRAHNRHAAERTLGRERVRARSAAAQRRRAVERYFEQRERERTERRRAEIERQREELGEAFRQLGCGGAEIERALACCASRAEAPPEERIRYALSCLAPRARSETPGAVEAA